MPPAATLTARLQRIPSWVWVLLFGVVLVFPGLGGFGFWDPWELKIADRAREIARSGHLFDPTVGGRFPAEPPLDLALAALGIKWFGASELAARMGNAVLALGSLFAVYFGGVALLRPRAGLLAALVLGTMPLFFEQSRQLTSDMPLVGGLALAFAGLGRFAFAADGRRAWRDLGLATAGMVVASLSGGVLLGAALPCLSLAAALLVAWSRCPSPRLPFGLTAVVGVGLLIAVFSTANVAGTYSFLLGGAPRGSVPTELFEYFVRQLGFGIFPWSALAVFALGRAFVRASDDEGQPEPSPPADPTAAVVRPAADRAGFVSAYLLVAASFGFALASVFVLLTGDARFPALAPIALAVGALLDEVLDRERPVPVLGLLAAVGTLVVARDLFLAPEELGSVHLLAKIQWPPMIKAGPALFAAGLVVAAGIGLGLVARNPVLVVPQVPPADAPAGEGGAPAGGFAAALRGAYARGASLFHRLAPWGIPLALGAAIVFALGVNHRLVPALAKHLSFKPAFQSLSKFSHPGDVFGKYRVTGHGLSFYGEQAMRELASQDQLLDFFKQDVRAFALLATEDLASLDTAFKIAALPYFVIDATSSRFVLASNRLPEGQTDINPLRRNVWMAPQPPVAVPQAGSTATAYQWKQESPADKPPWTWAFPLSATFDDSIELVGADFPTAVRRPGKIKLVLTFRVNKRPLPGYKIFVHVDTPGHPRLIGDHDPVGGAFPTAYWLPGEYVRDEHEIDVPYMTTPAGEYTVFMGIWPGGDQKRLKITQGTLNDGSDRARLGSIQIR